MGGRFLGYWTGFCLKYIMLTKIEIKGIDNISSNQKYFVASSHQSVFETFFLQTIFDNPVFILKKELTRIPLFGWYLKKMGCISIDRNKISKENLNFSDEVGKVIKNTNKILIIFPQGTRKSFDDRSKFKKGFSRIYNDLNIACLPVAINSGKVWPKRGKLIPNQRITVSILNMLPPGIEQNELANQVEQNIYNELDKNS
jgi:1-acyl-sn-glycerol-3-phosphate acyltransferase